MAGSSLIDSLGLRLKTGLQDPFWIGAHIANGVRNSALVATKYDFSNNLKEKAYLEVLNKEFDDAIKRYDGDFFIEVVLQRDKVLKKVFKCVAVARQTCPVPIWGRHLYQYLKEKETLSLLWVIPSKELCENKALMPLGVESPNSLLSQIDNFNSGRYLKMFKDFNGLKED